MPVNYKNFVKEMQISLDEIAQQNIFLILGEKTPQKWYSLCVHVITIAVLNSNRRVMTSLPTATAE